MYTKREALDLLLEARNLLHKQENGETVTSLDITLAHDCVDMVIDAIVQNNINLMDFYYPLWEQNMESPDPDEIPDELIAQAETSWGM